MYTNKCHAAHSGNYFMHQNVAIFEFSVFLSRTCWKSFLVLVASELSLVSQLKNTLDLFTSIQTMCSFACQYYLLPLVDNVLTRGKKKTHGFLLHINAAGPSFEIQLSRTFRLSETKFKTTSVKTFHSGQTSNSLRKD